MDKFPICWRGKALGEVAAEAESLYTCFSAECRLPGGGLWCVWLVGERGEVRLGVVEPRGETAEIRRRFSDRMTAPLGRILRGELRPAAGAGTEAWEPLRCAAIRTLWLRRQLQELGGVLTRQTDCGRALAAPYDPGRPFPLPSLFCFASIRQIGGASYAVFVFDREEWPVFFE